MPFDRFPQAFFVGSPGFADRMVVLEHVFLQAPSPVIIFPSPLEPAPEQVKIVDLQALDNVLRQNVVLGRSGKRIDKIGIVLHYSTGIGQTRDDRLPKVVSRAGFPELFFFVFVYGFIISEVQIPLSRFSKQDQQLLRAEPNIHEDLRKLRSGVEHGLPGKYDSR